MKIKFFFCLFKKSSHNHSHPPPDGRTEVRPTMADHPSESRSYTYFPFMDASVY